MQFQTFFSAGGSASDLLSPLASSSSSEKVRSADAAAVFNAYESVALAIAAWKEVDEEEDEDEEAEEQRKKR